MRPWRLIGAWGGQSLVESGRTFKPASVGKSKNAAGAAASRLEVYARGAPDGYTTLAAGAVLSSSIALPV